MAVISFLQTIVRYDSRVWLLLAVSEQQAPRLFICVTGRGTALSIARIKSAIIVRNNLVPFYSQDLSQRVTILAK